MNGHVCRQYLGCDDIECNIDNIRTIAESGDRIHRLPWEIRIAARRTRGITFGERIDLVTGIDSILHVGPELVEKLGTSALEESLQFTLVWNMALRVLEAPVRTRAQSWRNSQITGRRQNWAFLLCSTRTVTEFGRIICTPSTLVAKNFRSYLPY